MNTSKLGSRWAIAALLLPTLMALGAVAKAADNVRVINEWQKPYEVGLSVILDPGVYQKELSFSVPAGHRAVVEFVSIYLSVQEGNSASCLLLADHNPSTFQAAQDHALVLFPQGPDGQRPQHVLLHASQPIKMTADHSSVPGVNDVAIECTFAQPSTDPANGIIFRGSVSGYLVKLP